jgi:hypothetical protein
MRLFDTDFPDIFSWLLDEKGELPLPRKERGTAIPNPLKLIGVHLTAGASWLVFGLGIIWRVWQKNGKTWQDLSSKSSIIFVDR